MRNRDYFTRPNQHPSAHSGGWGDCKPLDARKEFLTGLWFVPIMLAFFGALYIMLPA